MKHIPNILSFIRILLIPLFVWQFFNGNTVNAAIILAVSGITDLLDGQLARRFGWVSQLGKMLDPAADKMTQVTVCIVLFIQFRQYWFFFIFLFMKDILMLILSGYLIKNDVRIEGAKWFGKIVTVLFYVTMTLIIFFPEMHAWITTTLLSVTTLCALFAAFMYFSDFINYCKSISK